ncbi:hypothetical protein Slin15195_G114010 [Septoria linicola]|uniref:Uncharacterized protein n=1 Tax=Septoria linicola TaxID=215465 RepID=A0A9Q9EPU0_9PEZI|nr:hypothetical protein Slin14017_G112330 [Septoria linicola]USW58082.1 hypothetical protein Slin15195_G114010 [Septoria linicola]
MFHMVFIDTLDDYYEDETQAPVQASSSASSPFKGKSPHECYLLLRQLVKDTESQVNWQLFVVVDERSLQDDTVILACMPLEKDGEAV